MMKSFNNYAKASLLKTFQKRNYFQLDSAMEVVMH